MMKLNHIGMVFQKKRVLEDVNFYLENKIYGLLGTNGSGKTTLIRIMTGLLKATKGEVDKDNHFMIGYLPQKFGLFKDLTLQKQMEYFCCLKGIEEKDWFQEIDRVLELVNMKDYDRYKCKSLSGGMVRRIGIAQALLGKPDFIIFDEPTTGLDPEERLRFKSIISSISKKQPILISTHIVEDIDSLCNELLILKESHLYQFHDIMQFIHSANNKVYTKDKIDINQDILIKEFIDHDCVKYRVISKDGINNVEPTLEDAYILFIRSHQK